MPYKKGVHDMGFQNRIKLGKQIAPGDSKSRSAVSSLIIPLYMQQVVVIGTPDHNAFRNSPLRYRADSHRGAE